MPLSFTKIKQIASEVLKREYETLTEESLYEEMNNVVSRQKHELILGVLGIEESRWDGKLNLRYDGSFNRVLRLFSEEHLKSVARKIWQSAFEDAEFSLTEKEKTHIRSEYRKAYMEAAEKEMRHLAEENAEKDALLQFEEFVKSQEQE